MQKLKAKPTISVIMSCYNSSEYVSEAIDSILRQTYADFEFVIINDGSTDETFKILQNYADDDSRIKLIDKQNTGLTDSLNVGLSASNGDWIARIDSDDVSHPRRLEQQVSFLNRNPDILLLGSSYEDIYPDGSRGKQHSLPTTHSLLYWHLKRLMKFFPHSSAFFKREIAQKIGGYRVRYKASQDWDMWLRFAETGKIACLNLPLVGIRRISTSISNQSNGEKQRLFGFAATVSHFLRIENCSDPSDDSEKSWQLFLHWLSNKIARDGVTQKLEQWKSIKNILPGPHYAEKKNCLQISNIGSLRYLPLIIFEKFCGCYLPQRYARDWQQKRESLAHGAKLQC